MDCLLSVPRYHALLFSSARLWETGPFEIAALILRPAFIAVLLRAAYRVERGRVRTSRVRTTLEYCGVSILYYRVQL